MVEGVVMNGDLCVGLKVCADNGVYFVIIIR